MYRLTLCGEDDSESNLPSVVGIYVIESQIIKQLILLCFAY